MINGIKEWINSLLCLGIFTSIVELALPKGNIKKYIYVIIGIVTVITIISPILSKDDYENVANEAVMAIATVSESSKSKASENIINNEEYINYQIGMVKNEYMNNLKRTMWEDIVSKGVVLDNIEIKIDDNYNVNEVKITIKEYGKEEFKTGSDILKYVYTYFNIKRENIVVEELD